MMTLITKRLRICLVLTLSVTTSTTALQKQTQLLSSLTKCQDNPWFQFQGDFGYNCEWVAAQDDGLCNWEVVEQENSTNALSVRTVGQTHCPVSCGKCEKQVTETKVYTNKVCYDAKASHYRQGGIVVAFESEDPQAQDWIGIYPMSSEIQIGSVLIEDPVAWSWTCDISPDGAPNVHEYDLSIACLTKYNQVTFRALPPGIYQAVLVRLNNQVFAASPSLFEILGPSSAGSELCSQRKLEAVTTKKQEPCHQLEVDATTFVQGQDILLHMTACPDSVARPDDFIAIYNADTQLEDIKGDANYHLWMWACGSQFCHQPASTGQLVFGASTNKHAWPLPPGNYQAHLIQRLPGQDRFASVAQSAVFSVIEEDIAHDLEDYTMPSRQLDCFDDLYAQSYCYPEGQDFAIHLVNECHVMGPNDWLGFYLADDCSLDDHLCHGEPVIWTMPCQEGGCHKGNVEYRFKGHSVDDEEEDGSIVLPAGNYRVVLVAEEDDTESPYHASLISHTFQVHHAQDPCDLAELQN